MFFNLLLTLVSTGLFVLCFPQGPLPLLVFVCLVPLAVALSGATARAGLFLGFLYGFVAWMAAAWWLAKGFYYYVALPWPAAWFWTVAGCMAAALPYAIFGLLCGFFGWMKNPSGRLKAAAALTVLTSWYPVLFPGNHVQALYAVPLLIQIVDLGGLPLLSLAVNLVNFFLAGAVLDRSGHRRPVRSVLTALTVLFVIIVYGAYRLDELHEKMSTAGEDRLVKVVSIQPNLPPSRQGVIRAFGGKENRNDLAVVLTLSGEAVERFPDAQAVIWPELPVVIPCDPTDKTSRKLRELSRKSGIPFIFNCNGDDPVTGDYFNTAQLILETGDYGSGYRKRMLLPFGEYLPGERHFPWMRRFFPDTYYYVPGADKTPLPIGGQWQVIPVLCYEVLFPGLVRDVVREGGRVIVNLVDDVWFGESDASAIHMALAVFRATEFRVPLVRVTNSGNGVFVQPTGEIVKGSRTPVFQARITSYPLFVPRTLSPYAAMGDVFLILLTLVWGGSLFWSLRKRLIKGKFIH